MNEEGRGRPADERALGELLRSRLRRPAAPPALRARVEAALAADVEALGAAGSRRLGRRAALGVRRATPALAAGIAALLVAGATAGLWAGYPAAARRLAADAVQGALEEYRRLETSGPAAPAEGPAELAARLSDALGVPVRLAEPRAAAIRLTGTAPISFFGAAGIAVLFEVDGRPVTLGLVRSPRGLPREGRVRLGRGGPMVGARGGVRIVLWRQGPLFCALAGEFSEPRLTALFRAIRPGLEVGG